MIIIISSSSPYHSATLLVLPLLKYEDMSFKKSMVMLDSEFGSRNSEREFEIPNEVQNDDYDHISNA